MGVGLLRPNWLDGATYLGQSTIDTFKCDIWQQGSAPSDDSTPFITYYKIIGQDYPARWVFFDGAQFDVMRWAVNETADEATWAIPPYCFDNLPSDRRTASAEVFKMKQLRVLPASP
jgi:hypothetical protein